MELYKDDFKFENDEYIQEIIRKQKNKKKDNEINREEYRKKIEIENSKQNIIEENEYNKIREQIDKVCQ